MTIMFSDMRGFTSISETYKNDPQGLTALMNRFLTPLTNAILNRKGTIDKYMGDAIMAFWNAPLDDPGHAANAALAALEMIGRLPALNAEWRAEAAAEGRVHHAVGIGIGLNSGPCSVGNMGSEQRFDYTVLATRSISLRASKVSRRPTGCRSWPANRCAPGHPASPGWSSISSRSRARTGRSVSSPCSATNARRPRRGFRPRPPTSVRCSKPIAPVIGPAL